MASLNKLHEQIIRHAARHHEFEGEEGPITAERVECAEEIALWSYENFSRLINSEAQSSSQANEDADRLYDFLFHELRVRNKISESVLREREQIQILEWQLRHSSRGLCRSSAQQEVVYVKGEIVHLIRRDSIGHLLARGGVR